MNDIYERLPLRKGDAAFGIDVQSILCYLKFKFNWVSCIVYGNLSQVGIYDSFR